VLSLDFFSLLYRNPGADQLASPTIRRHVWGEADVAGERFNGVMAAAS